MTPPVTNKETTEVQTPQQQQPQNTCWNLRVSAEADRGGRKYMEDVALVDFRREQNIEYAVFGVFDGHGGKQAARFAKAHLMNFIRQEKGFWSSRPENVKKAIHAGFITCHEAMRNKLPDWPKTVLGHACTAGTTASIAIIRGNKLYVAYVGDSGIVMGYEKCTEGQENCQPKPTFTGSSSHHIQFGVSTFSEQKQSGPAYSSTSSMKPKANYYYRELSTDHKPESLTEKRRIEAAGGEVAVKNGVNRVIWNRPRIHAIYNKHEFDRIPFLAVARSLGDLWSYNSSNNEFVVSPVPDIDVIDLTKPGEKARFIIVASDGVWNMVRPWDAVHLVATFNERKEQGKTEGSPAHDLVREALSRWRMRGLRADNTSAVVVWLDRASGAGQPDFVSRAWSSDSPANQAAGLENMSTSTGLEESNSGSRSLDQDEQFADEEDDDMADITMDRTVGKEMLAPANYPSQNRMRKYADLSIPHTMLMLMSDDEEVEVDDKVTAPGTDTPPTSETPLQDSEVSSTTDDQEPTSSSSSSPPTTTVIPTVSVTHSTRNRDTIVTTTTTIISRRKRTSSDLDADDESAPPTTPSSSSGDEQQTEPRVLRHTPKRKKSDATTDNVSSESVGSEMTTPGGSKRRSKRLIENKSSTTGSSNRSVGKQKASLTRSGGRRSARTPKK